MIQNMMKIATSAPSSANCSAPLPELQKLCSSQHVMQECSLVLSPITIQPESHVSKQFRCNSHSFGFPVISSVLVDIDILRTCNSLIKFETILTKKCLFSIKYCNGTFVLLTICQLSIFQNNCAYTSVKKNGGFFNLFEKYRKCFQFETLLPYIGANIPIKCPNVPVLWAVIV